jgi:cytochrome c biogenesis protein CcmG, thiol:disulfide interchange protein DsbE
MRRTIVLMTIAVMACRGAEKKAAAPPAAKPKTTVAKQPAPAPEPASASTNVGDAMPAYSAKTLDGAPYDLASEKGSVVLVNVWATWCGPCRFEIPELQKMHDEHGKHGFKVVGVSVDEGDAKDVKQFVADQKMTYPIVLDPDGRIANLLATTVLPTSVLLDRHGKIVWREIGAIPAGEPTLKKALAAALAGS